MDDYITIAHGLPHFRVEGTTEIRPMAGRRHLAVTRGHVTDGKDAEAHMCPGCGSRMHVHSHEVVQLRHVPILTLEHVLEVGYDRYRCPRYGCIASQDIPRSGAGAT